MTNQNGGLKYLCLTFTAAMQCLDAKISLVPSIVPHSTFNLIGPCNTHPNRQSHKDTCLHHWHLKQVKHNSFKMNLRGIFSTSPHCVSRKWIGEKMRIQILILGYKCMLNKKVGDAPTPVHGSHLHQAILFIYRFFIYKFAKNSSQVEYTYYSGHSHGLFIRPTTPINRLSQEDNENVCSGKEAGRGWKYWKYDFKKNIIYCPVSFKWNLL